MLSNDVAKSAALSEVSVHLTRALEVLEDVPPESFADPEDRFRVQELIARAGGVAVSELARGEDFRLDCSFPEIYGSEASDHRS
jgi:hypothetical protein